jgi:hypothetical protein
MRAVLNVLPTRAGREATAMAIEHHRSPAAVIHRRSPDIENQAVFAIGRFVLSVGGSRTLHGGWAKDGRIAHAGPCRHRGCCLEAIRARYRAAIGNALEGQRTTAVATADTPGVYLDFDEWTDRLGGPGAVRGAHRQPQ